MAIISRPLKEGSNLTYAAKVAAGYRDILDIELDADIDLLLNAWNAGVDPVNIKSNAVETLKIKDLNVTTAKLAALAVTAAKLATDAVETAKIKALNVTTPKLAVDATVNGFQSGNVTTSLSIIGSDATENNLVVLPSITTRGGRVRVAGLILLSHSPPILEERIKIRVYRDAAVIFTGNTVVLYGASSATKIALPISIDVMGHPGAGSYVHKVTVQKEQTGFPGTSAMMLTTDSSGAGVVYVEERG
jgi:hypothetical protein